MSAPDFRPMLADLGMDPASCRVLALLPLVGVAWADGAVQAQEKRAILEFAEAQGALDAEGALILEDWLRFAPTQGYLDRGLDALCQLVAAGHASFDAALLDVLPTKARAVAEAAGGGLFSLFRKVSSEEQAALDRLARQLAAARASAADEEGTDPGSHRKRVTVFEEDDDEDDEEGLIGVLVHEGATRRKVRVPDDGLLVGSGGQSTVRLPGLAAEHFRVETRRRRFYVAALADQAPVTVAGERVGYRRLLGGETIQAGPETFTFKMATRG